MSVDLLLRALRKCEHRVWTFVVQAEMTRLGMNVKQLLARGETEEAYQRLADKIHKKILVMSDKDWTKAFNYGRASVERCDL